MIDVHSNLSKFKTETDVTEVLKYIALRTSMVYHDKGGLFYEHIYFGYSPTDFDILLVYKISEGKFILAINKPTRITREVSEHTVEDIISKILDNIKINKKILINTRKHDIEQDFL